MLAGASTPSLVSSGTTAPRTAAGKNACCATAEAKKQEDPEPALTRATATGQVDNTARVSHTTPGTIRKTRVPDTRSRGLTVDTAKTPIAVITVHQSVPSSPASTTDDPNTRLDPSNSSSSNARQPGTFRTGN